MCFRASPFRFVQKFKIEHQVEDLFVLDRDSPLLSLFQIIKLFLNNNENINNKINNLILNKLKKGRELYDRYNSRNKEKINIEEENRNIINAFLKKNKY